MRAHGIADGEVRVWRDEMEQAVAPVAGRADPAASAEATLTRAAKRLAKVAADPGRVIRLLAGLGQLPPGRVRQAALACLGFDAPTAAGLDLRLANRWPLFRGGRAAMQGRPPLTLDEAAAVLKRRAGQLQALGAACRGLSMGQVQDRLQRRQGLHGASGDLATAGWDSAALGRAAPLGSLTLALSADKHNEDGRFYFGLLACTEAVDLRQLAAEQNAYLRRHGANRAAVLASPLPFGGTAVAALAALLPRESTQAVGPHLWQLIAAAAATGESALAPARPDD